MQDDLRGSLRSGRRYASGFESGPSIEDPFVKSAQPPEKREGKTSLLTGVLIGIAATLLLAGVTVAILLGVGVWKFTKDHEAATAQEDREARDREREERAAAKSAEPDEPKAPVPSASSSGEPKPANGAPGDTKETLIGDITVVDAGFNAPTLAAVLSAQRAIAAKKNQKFLVMTLTKDCGPCRDFLKTLSDPKLQVALKNVRIVKVDTGVFEDDLERLNVPTKVWPGFFLTAPNLQPSDFITGGEWDDDVAQNIAPVIGPFVKGQLKNRRQPWKPGKSGQGSSMPI